MNPKIYFDPGTGTNAASPHHPTHEEIAALAQHIYEEEGCPAGRADAHWREAERHLRHYAEADAIAPPTHSGNGNTPARRGITSVPASKPAKQRAGASVR